MRRRLCNGLMAGFAGLGGLAGALIVVSVLGWIVVKGAPHVNVAFLLESTRESGAAGGILYQILGTLILMTTTAVITVPLSLGLALAATRYLPRESWRTGVQGLLHLLNATPSILFGILGLLFFFHALGWGKSWLAGGIVLAWMILPTVTISLIKSIEAVPSSQLDAAAGLGLTRSQTVRAVIVPQSMRGLLTGGLLGLARAAGETAPILFVATVFAGPTLPSGIRENPVLALPYHIFVLAQDSFQEAARNNLWGTALVLVTLVVGLSLLALPLRINKSHAHE